MSWEGNYGNLVTIVTQWSIYNNDQYIDTSLTVNDKMKFAAVFLLACIVGMYYKL